MDGLAKVYIAPGEWHGQDKAVPTVELDFMFGVAGHGDDGSAGGPCKLKASRLRFETRPAGAVGDDDDPLVFARGCQRQIRRSHPCALSLVQPIFRESLPQGKSAGILFYQPADLGLAEGSDQKNPQTGG